MRKLEIHKNTETQNTLRRWYHYRNPARVVFNFIVIYTCRYLPFLELKNVFYRMIGVKIGKDVSVSLGAVFDIFFPELIEIGNNTIIGYNATILAHEFLIDELRKGKIRIGNNVLIGAKSVILPGVSIGDNARVSACSLVNKDVSENSFVGGVPAKEIK